MVEFAADIEITLEANPGTAERQKFADYRKLGINRLSIGIQSFNDQQLKNLGRIHASDDSRKAVEFAYAAGFENINLDIMYGLENQSLASALADLQETIALAPKHISWYQLTIEANTEFFKRPPALPVENLLIDIQDQGLELLSASGFQRYEVSAFSRPDHQARHNVNYWQFGDYLGIGAGAHGKISIAAQQGFESIVRTRKKKQPGHYLADCTAATAVVSAQDLPLEFMLNALRLQNGFTLDLFEAHTDLPFSTVAKQIESLHAKGLLEVTDDRIKTSPKGMQFLNSVLEEFL
jgi:oxygen-independent coproporphyrinogen-3 oxidase